MGKGRKDDHNLGGKKQTRKEKGKVGKKLES